MDKLSAIEQIHRRYIGGFINADRAMSQISSILSTKAVEFVDAKLYDAKTGEVLIQSGSGVLSYRQ